MRKQRTETRAPALAGTDLATDESFRVLRSNLLVTLSDLANPIVMITSAQAGEGKTSSCAGLATSLASIGRRLVVVDFDLRKPSLHRLFGVDNEVGVTSFLRDEKPLSECLRYVDLSASASGVVGGFYLLAAGPAVPNPTELLSSPRTKRLLDGLSAQADVVLVDSPPVLPIADTLEIGRRTAGAILVVEARRTEIGAAQRAKDALIRNQTRLLGVILNKVERQDLSYGYGQDLPVVRSNGAGDAAVSG